MATRRSARRGASYEDGYRYAARLPRGVEHEHEEGYRRAEVLHARAAWATTAAATTTTHTPHVAHLRHNNNPHNELCLVVVDLVLEVVQVDARHHVAEVLRSRRRRVWCGV